MNRLLRAICIVLLTFFFALNTGCTRQALQSADVPKNSESQAAESANSKTTAMQAKFYYTAAADRRLEKLEAQLKKDFDFKDAKVYYYYNYNDLNEDRSNELMVYVKIERHNLVESALLIYDSDYKLRLNLKNQDPPLIVLPETYNQWHELAVFIGNGTYKRIQMGENGYQLTENSKENVIEYSQINGQGYLADTKDKKGFQIR